MLVETAACLMRGSSVFYAPAMQNIALSAHASNVDIVARVIAIVGVAIALAGLVLGSYQWRHSGPELAAKIEAYVGKDRVGHQDEQWTFTIDVWNKGRMSATVRDILVVRLRRRWHFSWWLSWWLRLIRRDFAFGTTARPVEGTFPNEVKGTFPKEIPPTGYLRARTVVDADLFEPHIRWVQAVVLTGDMHYSRSASIPAPNHARLPRGLRKMLADANDD